MCVHSTLCLVSMMFGDHMSLYWYICIYNKKKTKCKFLVPHYGGGRSVIHCAFTNDVLFKAYM